MLVAAPTRTCRHPRHGETATFIETAAESGGARTIIHLALDPAGGGPALSHAAFAKDIEVLEGTLTLHLADAARSLVAGERAVVPVGVAHRLANDTLAPVAVLVDLHPGHAGFERALRAWSGLAGDGLVSRRGIPLNPYHLAVLLEWAESTAPGVSADAVRTLASRARASGVEARLAERYRCA